MLYFAYGSNLDWKQMRQRCPSARFLCIAMLPNHRLTFSRESATRHCGVADAVPANGSQVWGVVYQIEEADAVRLDEIEGFVPGREDMNSYVRREAEVLQEGSLDGPLVVSIYSATPDGQTHLPNQDYKDLILKGARNWKLPASYIELLEAIETTGLPKAPQEQLVRAEAPSHNLLHSVLPPLTEESAIESLRDFFRDKPFVFFGTGMSCALDPRFGMLALRDYLARSIVPEAHAEEQERQWQQVLKSLQEGKDLESALNNVTDPFLLGMITSTTGRFVAAVDREYAFRIASGEATWPATRFFQRLVATLPEGDCILHALTPNYDLLFEYACDSSGVPYTSGFFGGVERRPAWDAVDPSLLQPERVCQRGRLKTIYRHRKHVRLYKVHGSLNYFFHRNAVVENNSWAWDAPDFCLRVMITPGLSKYQTLQTYRQELLQRADIAIDKESHFLFLGYGFNDSHLEQYIKRKLVAQGCKGLIVTKDSNPRIESLLAEATNLWLVCKMPDGNNEGTLIFNKSFSGPLFLPLRRLWEISEFTSQVLGG